MYQKGLPVTGDFICRCKHCNEEYDLRIVYTRSKQLKTRALQCPKCKKRIGQVN